MHEVHKYSLGSDFPEDGRMKDGRRQTPVSEHQLVTAPHSGYAGTERPRGNRGSIHHMQNATPNHEADFGAVHSETALGLDVTMELLSVGKLKLVFKP